MLHTGNGKAARPQTPVRLSPVDEAAPFPAVSAASQDELQRAVTTARVAQPEWASRPLEERARLLERAAKAMLRDRNLLLHLVKEEMGKHEVESLFTEALGPLDAVKAWHKIVARSQSRRVSLNPLAFPRKRARVEMVPRGVIGIIAPWNFPVSGLYRSVVPALLSGNAVVLKPSEYTPKSSAWFMEHFARELPHGIATVVQGDGAVGAALVDSGIDACVFTGSVKAGGRVRVRCAELGIPSSIEMGGKDAAIVLGDCDLDRTVMGITHWALSNAGQACGAIEVAYVEERIADEFVARMRSAWEQLRTGPGDDDVEVAPLANARQLAVVEAHVEDALKKGAKLVCGGKRTGRGFGHLPTLLDRCTSSMDVVREETFGPVLAVVRVWGADEAVRAINAAKYGLGASIWTRDVARAERLVERLDVGVANINTHAFTGAVPQLPWSGTRATGFGVANSELSLVNFCHPKTVAIDEADAPEPFYMPFDATLRQLGEALVKAQLGELLGAVKLPLLLRRRQKRIRDFFRR
ncbi:MAG TPA: aldehyde dehydrogenase family protein [Polyangiaceae bacterium]|nr:aldehyde dehydrogenase family protein [Polyangiaceae bacterium]